MSNVLNKAASCTGPEDAGANEFGCMKLTATNTHESASMPDSWKGRYVRLIFFSTTATDYVEFGWSSAAAPEIDTSVAASTAGATAKVGEPLFAMQSIEVLVPDFGSGITTKLVREASAATKILWAILAERSP